MIHVLNPPLVPSLPTLTSSYMTDTPDTPAIHPVEDSVQQWLREAGDYARRQPTQVLGAACAAGVLLNVVPAKVIVRSALTAASALGRPALLALGVMKVFELVTSRTHTHPAAAV